MGWWMDLFGKEPAGPKEYYVSWSAPANTNTSSVPFEYIVHPTSEGVIYYGAIISSENLESASNLITSHFPNANIQFMEKANKERLRMYQQTRSKTGVKTIQPD